MTWCVKKTSEILNQVQDDMMCQKKECDPESFFEASAYEEAQRSG